MRDASFAAAPVESLHVIDDESREPEDFSVTFAADASFL